jgi:putative transcriptional regulator
MTKPHHHIPEELLLDYASGALSWPFGVLVASHMALCPRCRSEVTLFENVAGDLMNVMPKAPTEADLLSRTLACLGEPEPRGPEGEREEPWAEIDMRVPQPLRGLVGGSLDQLPWKGLGGFRQVGVLEDASRHASNLMRIRPGMAMPRHTHGGLELTLVLTGGFSDENGHYRRGDVSVADESVDHRPIADDDEECLCLAVSENSPRLTGPFGRMLNPFLSV